MHQTLAVKPLQTRVTTALKLGFLASGRGTNLQAILDACDSGQIEAEPAVVISNNSGSAALDRARSAGIDTVHLSAFTQPDPDLLDKAICTEFETRNVDLVVLAGYAKQLGPITLMTFRNRVINVHPSLLPKFGGKGMWGKRVHEAVIAAGETETGVSVHLVDEEYDTGPVITQARIPVFKGDDADTVAARLLPEEHKLYVETLALISRKKIQLPV